MLYKTYLSKDNTLYYSNPNSNLGKDPIMELTYGGIYGYYSRVIFDFNMDEVADKIKEREILEESLKHYLVLYNTYTYSLDYKGTLPSSFTLELFLINDEWDEGNGYSLKYNKSGSYNTNVRYSEQASNFNNSKTNTPWTSTAFNEVVKEIEFDLGRESIEVDVTDLINDRINGNRNFNGFGLRFKNREGEITEKQFSITFYGKDTHTFFKPHIASVWDETLKDCRCNFKSDDVNKLFLYTNINSVPINLDEIPSRVDILDDDDNVVFSTNDITHEYKGIYSITINPDVNLDKNQKYYDNWTGIKLNGHDLPDIIMDFDVLEDNLQFNSTLYTTYYQDDIKCNLFGIKHNEYIKTTDKRSLLLTVEDFEGEIDADITMDIYTKQTDNKIVIIEDEPFLSLKQGKIKNIDFSMFTPQQYYIDLYINNGFNKNHIYTTKFNILEDRYKTKLKPTTWTLKKLYLLDVHKNYIVNKGKPITVVKKTKD